MPCRWQGKTIIVMDMVCVLEPYTTDSVKAGAGQQGNSHAVQRVKKVVSSTPVKPTHFSGKPYGTMLLIYIKS